MRAHSAAILLSAALIVPSQAAPRDPGAEHEGTQARRDEPADEGRVAHNEPSVPAPGPLDNS